MKRKAGLFAITVLAVMMIAGAAIAGVGSPSHTNVVGTQYFPDGAPAGGTSNLTRTDDGEALLLTIEAEGLTPGDAYTVWWIVFNEPGECLEGCGEDDIFNEDGTPNGGQIVATQVGIGNATGNVAKANGTAEFGAKLVAGDGGTDHQVLIPAFGGGGEVLLAGNGNSAEVHLIVQSHGQARGGPQLTSQLSNVEFGCTPECADLQFAVHLP